MVLKESLFVAGFAHFRGRSLPEGVSVSNDCTIYLLRFDGNDKRAGNKIHSTPSIQLPVPTLRAEETSYGLDGQCQGGTVITRSDSIRP